MKPNQNTRSSAGWTIFALILFIAIIATIVALIGDSKKTRQPREGRAAELRAAGVPADQAWEISGEGRAMSDFDRLAHMRGVDAIIEAAGAQRLVQLLGEARALAFYHYPAEAIRDPSREATRAIALASAILAARDMVDAVEISEDEIARASRVLAVAGTTADDVYDTAAAIVLLRKRIAAGSMTP